MPGDDGRDGLPDLYQVFTRAVRDNVFQILEHLSTVQPRNEDLPIEYNEVQDGGNAVSRVLAVGAAATERVDIKPRPGHTVHISSLSIRPADPNVDAGDLDITVRNAGRILQRTTHRQFRRPAMLDRNDTLSVSVTNNSGAEVKVYIDVQGWIRRNVEKL